MASFIVRILWTRGSNTKSVWSNIVYYNCITNFDLEEATLSGIGWSHDTVSVLYQNKPNIIREKPNISDTSLSHGSKMGHMGQRWITWVKH